LAHLEGESHICNPKPNAARVLGTAIAGGIGGAVLGTVLLLLTFEVLGFADYTGLGGLYLGVFFGGATGAIAASRFVNRRR
jgi:hypothetical protein